MRPNKSVYADNLQAGRFAVSLSLHFTAKQPAYKLRVTEALSEKTMYYKIVDKFGPESGDAWASYLSWRGLELSRFDSVDGILRGDLFTPESEVDWNNCLAEKDLPVLIKNLEYAKSIKAKHAGSELVGVEINIEKDYLEKRNLLGYEVIDSDWVVSMLTNWGTDEEGLFSQYIESNGLIASAQTALKVKDSLRRFFPEDAHACECSVWAVFAIVT